MTLVVNLFAGPGAGKSTLAAGLFYRLKSETNLVVELSREYAKDLVWEGRHHMLDGHVARQLYILAKQTKRLFDLEGKVDVVVTDSPLMLCSLYAGAAPASYHQLVRDLHGQFNSLNFFVDRRKQYSPVGRGQTEDEARRLDEQTILLVGSTVDLVYVTGDSAGLGVMFDAVRQAAG